MQIRNVISLFSGLLITRYDIKSNWWTQTKYKCTQNTKTFLCPKFVRHHFLGKWKSNTLAKKISYVCTDIWHALKHTTYSKHIFLRVHEVFLSFFAKSDANICFSIHSVLLFKDTRAIIMLQYILFDIGSSGAKIQKKEPNMENSVLIAFQLLSRYLEMLYVWVWVFLCEPEKKEFVFSR